MLINFWKDSHSVSGPFLAPHRAVKNAIPALVIFWLTIPDLNSSWARDVLMTTLLAFSSIGAQRHFVLWFLADCMRQDVSGCTEYSLT